MKTKKIQSQQDYIQLVEELLEHDRHYYEECKPVISDYEYDLLLKELESYEKEHPDLALDYSPTKRVGESLTKGFQQKEHVKPMLSLANTYSEEEIEDFIKRVYKLTERDDIKFCCELKIDGTALSLRYENGNFVRAVTRGNGKIGDDVTANVKTIKTLPLRLKGDNIPPLLEVRGEVFMHKKVFMDLNIQREEKGLEPWANPRNAAAGSLKLLDPKEVSLRKLDLLCYGVAEGEIDISSQYETHKYLKKLGLPVSKESHFHRCSSIGEILKFSNKIQKAREDISFEIDGIVLKVDDLKYHPKLGFTGKSPRYAVAYKFAPEQAFTKINDITVQVGRTGVLTPVAELEPIQLAGSTISRATLHNEDEVKRKDIRISDWVVIEKGGDVIPKVVKVDFSKRKKNSLAWHMPKKCPVCGSEVIQKENEVAHRCINVNCVGRQLRHIIFFASKAAMDIEHMGEKVVSQLFEKKLILRPSDIYLLDEESLSQLEGFKEKSIKNLLDSIEKSKSCFLDRFIMGLEIPYVGKETAELLADYAEDLEHLMKLKKDELITIEGIGEKVASAIEDFFNDPKNIEEIEHLLKNGVIPKKIKSKKIKNHIFENKTFVLTGSLEKFTRSEASSLIKERNGKVLGSVSKKTDYILAGDNPGSKLDKAEELNIKVLSEEEFEKLL